MHSYLRAQANVLSNVLVLNAVLMQICFHSCVVLRYCRCELSWLNALLSTHSCILVVSCLQALHRRPWSTFKRVRRWTSWRHPLTRCRGRPSSSSCSSPSSRWCPSSTRSDCKRALRRRRRSDGRASRCGAPLRHIAHYHVTFSRIAALRGRVLSRDVVVYRHVTFPRTAASRCRVLSRHVVTHRHGISFCSNTMIVWSILEWTANVRFCDASWTKTVRADLCVFMCE